MRALTDQERLEAAGLLLHGPNWQSPLARDLKVADRTMRRWFSERYQIGAGIWTDIAKLLDARAVELEPKPAECRVLAALLRERAKG